MTEMKTYMCAIKNPKEQKNRSWFYNVFLGRQNVEKNKPHRNEIQVNWIIPSLTTKEIELLQKRNIKVINLFEDIEIEIVEDDDDLLVFKEGFEILLEMIDRLKNKDKKLFQNEIDDFLYDSKGYPTKEGTKIKECKELIKKYDEILGDS